MVLRYCSFVIKGLKEHYKDGWNWIDSAFLILSLVAVSMWASIINEHLSLVALKDFNELRNISNNEVFLDISIKMLNY